MRKEITNIQIRNKTEKQIKTKKRQKKNQRINYKKDNINKV